MSALVVPAPLWRRLAASIYDGLLLAGILIAAASVDLLLQKAAGTARHQVTSALLLLSALAFFGWFWTHGGQTLGMRAWRLQVRRDDGTPVTWPVALARYAFMLLLFFALPLGLDLRLKGATALAAITWAVPAGNLLWVLVDRRRRAGHDIASGCEVVVLPGP